MIALSSVLLLAIWFVTGQFSWLLVVIASAAIILLYYRQWLELGIMLLLCSQLFLMGSVEVLMEKQEVQQSQFTIISMPMMTTSGCRAYAKTAVGDQWLVTVRTQADCPLIYGAETVAQVIPTPISGLQNFHLFNRQQFYYKQKRVRGELQVQQLETATVVDQRYQQQTALLTWLEHRLNNPKAMMLFKTMVLGETSQFDEAVRETWQSLNISHILAISGLHAAIFIACIRSLCIRLTILKHYQPWIIGGLLLILRWYNFASVSFSRVVCMWFIHLLLGKRWSQYHKLLLASAVVALIWPQELLGVGFYYSFACAFLLTLGHKLWRRKGGWLLIPLTLQLWLLPITLWQTGEFLFVSVLANLLAIPFITILLPGLLILPLIPDLAELVVSFYQGGVTFFAWLANTFPLQLQVGQVILGGCFAWVMLSLALYKAQERQQYFRMILITLLLGGLIWASTWRQPEVTMLDIGQGDATVIIDERRKAFIIDTGGPSKLEPHHIEQEPVVESYLRQRGIQTIETLVLTHGDLDHLGYALALFARGEVKIENLVMATVEQHTTEEQQLIALAQAAGTHVHFVQAGMQIHFGTQVFEVLAPQTSQRQDINNHSLVLWSQIGQLAWLFTGDIEQQSEQALVQRYPDLPVDVLKVAHHGSKTSTSLLFLLAYQPEYALISAGKNNRFNHPHPTVVQRLSDYGVRYVTTSEVGMIRFFPKQHEWQCFQQDQCFK